MEAQWVKGQKQSRRTKYLALKWFMDNEARAKTFEKPWFEHRRVKLFPRLSHKPRSWNREQNYRLRLHLEVFSYSSTALTTTDIGQVNSSTQPVTCFGHQEGRRVSEWPKIFEPCPTHLSRVAFPPWLRACCTVLISNSTSRLLYYGSSYKQLHFLYSGCFSPIWKFCYCKSISYVAITQQYLM